MTQKEAIKALKTLIPNSGRISAQSINGKLFIVFKSNHENIYMVNSTLENSDESVNSDVLYSIEECNDWIEANK